MTMQEEEKQPETSDVPEEAPDQEEVHEFAENGEKKPTEDDAVGEDADEKKKVNKVSADAPWSERMWEVFTTFWPLGLIAFGGPQAHVAILRDHLVEQRDWLDEEQVSFGCLSWMVGLWQSRLTDIVLHIVYRALCYWSRTAWANFHPACDFNSSQPCWAFGWFDVSTIHIGILPLRSTTHGSYCF